MCYLYFFLLQQKKKTFHKNRCTWAVVANKFSWNKIFFNCVCFSSTVLQKMQSNEWAQVLRGVGSLVTRIWRLSKCSNGGWFVFSFFLLKNKSNNFASGSKMLTKGLNAESRKWQLICPAERFLDVKRNWEITKFLSDGERRLSKIVFFSFSFAVGQNNSSCWLVFCCNLQKNERKNIMVCNKCVSCLTPLQLFTYHLALVDSGKSF